MIPPLIYAAEAAGTLDAEHLERVTSAIVATLCDPADAIAYEVARAQMGTVPPSARWLVELQVEAEMAANRQALRMPCGLRR